MSDFFDFGMVQKIIVEGDQGRIEMRAAALSIEVDHGVEEYNFSFRSDSRMQMVRTGPRKLILTVLLPDDEPVMFTPVMTTEPPQNEPARRIRTRKQGKIP